MTFKRLLFVLLLFAGFTAADEVSNSAAYQYLLNQYDSSGDLSWAYRLARVSVAEGQPERAAQWFSVLSAENWRMGVDTTRTGIGPAQIENLDALVALQSQASVVGSPGITVHRFTDANLIPESIAFDAGNRVLYAGSLNKNKVLAVNLATEAGAIRVREIGVGYLGAVYGIKFDASSGELWVLHNRLSESGMQGALTVFNSDGLSMREYSSGAVDESEFNDLCLSKENVFVSDSRNDSVWQGSRSGNHLQLLIEPGDLPYANGIACDENSSTVYVAGATGVYRVALDGRQTLTKLSVPQGFSLGGIDGLYIDGDLLIGIQNALGAPKVVVGTMDENRVFGITFHDVMSTEYRIPTTGFIKDHCLYYIGRSSLDALTADFQIDPAAMPPQPGNVLRLPIDHVGRQCSL